MSTWEGLILQAMRHEGEQWDDVVACTLDEEGLAKPFGAGFGVAEGAPFTLWTAKRVYFPVMYDGAEWVGSVPRDPCGEACNHHGA